MTVKQKKFGLSSLFGRKERAKQALAEARREYDKALKTAKESLQAREESVAVREQEIDSELKRREERIRKTLQSRMQHEVQQTASHLADLASAKHMETLYAALAQAVRQNPMPVFATFLTVELFRESILREYRVQLKVDA